MSNSIIEVKNISKKYNITHQQGGYVAMRDVMANVAKKPFSFLKRKAKAKIGNSTREEFWALKDIDFEIQPGEAVGIIGANGAGKSTLLKILTGITPPTTGEIKMRGKVASLLEVGTGFHPEMTGRENVFLNGAILGMSKEEIAKKFDAIVDFSGVRKFIDTPVKRYSSGMVVRLGFSVAAHMEPDILLVDEVLAVGDAQFQKKCLGKMNEVTSQAGRTILFVSHNLDAIQKLCKRCILIEEGKIKMIGETKEVIGKYLNEQTKDELQKTSWSGEKGDEHMKLKKTWIKNIDKNQRFQTSTNLEIGIKAEILIPINNLILGFTLFSEFGYELAYVLYDDNSQTPPSTIYPGKLIKKFIIPANTLAKGIYKIEFDIGIHGKKRIIKNEGQLFFTLGDSLEGLGKRFPLPNIQGRSSLFRPNWSINN